MTLDEAIKYTEGKSKYHNELFNEHKQLAEWLQQFKTLKLPRPIIRDGSGKLIKKYSKYDWYSELQEKILEIMCKYGDYVSCCQDYGNDNPSTILEKVELAERIGKLVTIRVSWLESLDIDEKAGSEIFAEINYKNSCQGCFEKQ